MTKHIVAIVLVAVGVFFLLGNLGILQVSLGDLLRTWWPVALIGVGLFLLVPKKGKLGKAEVKAEPKAKK